MRKIKFETGKFYHVFNRGVDKREIFLEEKDYLRFLKSMLEFNRPEVIDSLYRQDQLRRQAREGAAASKPPSGYDFRKNRSHSVALIEIIAYCLNPNHYHLLLKQLVDGGISKFMHKVSMGYTHYFNQKYNRSGSLFQGPFKAVEIKSDAQLWYVSAYINGNPEIHQITPASKWPWSSYQDYLGQRQGKLANKSVILKDFKNIKDYEEYVREVVKNSSEIKEELKKAQIE